MMTLKGVKGSAFIFYGGGKSGEKGKNESFHGLLKKRKSGSGLGQRTVTVSGTLKSADLAGGDMVIWCTYDYV